LGSIQFYHIPLEFRGQMLVAGYATIGEVEAVLPLNREATARAALPVAVLLENSTPLAARVHG
jgi:hypothetical protein